MSYSRGKFGVEYQPRGGAETHHLRGLVFVVLALVAVAFIWYKIAKHHSGNDDLRTDPPSNEPQKPKPAPKPDKKIVVVPTTNILKQTTFSATNGLTKVVETSSTNTPVRKTKPVELPPPKPTPTVAPAVRPLVTQLEETRDRRSHQDQMLIDRYTTAERQEDSKLAIDAIKKLYNRPTMADLKDLLLRRLGDLNRELLFSGQPTTWTATVTVRRGDGRERIAREHRTTPAAIAKLNPTVKWEKLKPGDKVCVLEFPNACLVIHKQNGYADLSFKNDQFFRRYYLSTAKSAKCDVYTISPEGGSTFHARIRELGMKIAAPDRAELEMFLAPGSRITVTEQ